jgi:hypothetical protein
MATLTKESTAQLVTNLRRGFDVDGANPAGGPFTDGFQEHEIVMTSDVPSTVHTALSRWEGQTCSVCCAMPVLPIVD